MLKLENKYVIDHVIDRVSESKMIRQVIICTSDNIKDDVIYDHCTQRNIKCFRGSELDVLNRYYETAKKYGSSYIMLFIRIYHIKIQTDM
jgi:spore coat polysaccharide biosynthesis protein SpsF